MKLSLNNILRIIAILVLAFTIYQMIENQKQLHQMKIEINNIERQSEQIDKFLNNNYIMDINK